MGGKCDLCGRKVVLEEEKKKSNLIVFEPELDNWDRVIVVRWPGRRAFFDMFTNPEFLMESPAGVNPL